MSFHSECVKESSSGAAGTGASSEQEGDVERERDRDSSRSDRDRDRDRDSSPLLSSTVPTPPPPPFQVPCYCVQSLSFNVTARNVVAGLEVFKVLERNRRRKIGTRRRGGRRRWRPVGGEVEAEKMEETELGGKRTEAWSGVARWLLLEPEQRAMLRGGVG